MPGLKGEVDAFTLGFHAAAFGFVGHFDPLLCGSPTIFRTPLSAAILVWYLLT